MSKRHNLHQRTTSMFAFPEDYTIYQTPIVDGNETSRALPPTKLVMMPPKPPVVVVDEARVKADDKKPSGASADAPKNDG
ncbi:hypothetical protein MRB53_029324 [Persea americana]|uniref:Uncharacterized protein n=1 Tax=Persea americana TaxID=3435 RepID=A0ACC2KI07_PERAE|nr:hypothetical protein MRB53_029324 [Persea americana]